MLCSPLHRCQWVTWQPGPRLIILGAVHGNETCGTQALERLMAELQTQRLRLVRGVLTVVPVCNPWAYAQGQRQGQRNLNRRLMPVDQPQDFEDHVANQLCPWLADHDVLLDLHSFHTPGEPFVMLGPPDNTGTLEPFAHAAAEAVLARHLGPHRIVEGWLETYAQGMERRRRWWAQRGGVPEAGLCDPSYGMGTTEYMRQQGGYGLTLECGHHTAPEAPEVAYHAIRQTLSVLGLIDQPPIAPSPGHELLTLCDVHDRHHQGDTLVQDWISFSPVNQGQVIGHRHDGQALRAREDGFIVFPNPQAAVGAEWFYFAKRSSRQW